MTTSFNFMQQIAPQVSSGKSFKNVSGPAGSKAAGRAAGNTATNHSDTNFNSTLRKVSGYQTPSRASDPSNGRHSATDDGGFSADGFEEVASLAGVRAENLIGGHQQHQIFGEGPMGEPDAAWVKGQLLELLQKLEIRNLPFAENGNTLCPNDKEESGSATQPVGKEMDQNAATRQFALEKLEAILRQLQISDGFKPRPEIQRLIDVIRAANGADSGADAKTAEIAKLIQGLTSKPDNAEVEGNIQNSGARNQSAAIAGSVKAIPAEGVKVPTSDGSAPPVQADSIRLDAVKFAIAEGGDGSQKPQTHLSPSDILKAVAREDVSNNQGPSNASGPGSQSNAAIDTVQDPLIGQKNDQNMPDKKPNDSGLNPTDSNLYSNPSASKSEPNLETTKTTGIRTEVGSGKQMGARVMNPDAGKEESFSFNQHQSELKTTEGQQLAKEAESFSKDVRFQTLDQIVQKAVMHFKNGQNEVQLKLKPDFLGQIRMQIITENQQVTVRILTEYPMVKELIENNVQQLKSGLQQYGLEIDELEVSVAHDSEQHVADHQKASGSKLQNPNSNDDPEEKAGSQNTTASASQPINAAQNGLIDFFA